MLPHARSNCCAVGGSASDWDFRDIGAVGDGSLDEPLLSFDPERPPDTRSPRVQAGAQSPARGRPLVSSATQTAGRLSPPPPVRYHAASQTASPVATTCTVGTSARPLPPPILEPPGVATSDLATSTARFMSAHPEAPSDAISDLVIQQSLVPLRRPNAILVRSVIATQFC